jgi:hypothetical protein
VRVEGRATYPQPAPPDSLVVLDASQSPPVVTATLDQGLEHTVQGPPQAVAITPDGKLAFVAAPTRYAYDGNKELFDNFAIKPDADQKEPATLLRSSKPGFWTRFVRAFCLPGLRAPSRPRSRTKPRPAQW